MDHALFVNVLQAQQRLVISRTASSGRQTLRRRSKSSSVSPSRYSMTR